MRAVVWTVVALAASVLPPLFTEPGDFRAGRRSRLLFESAAVDFGTVFAGERVAAEYAFTNPTAEPLRITGASSPCGCVQASPSPLWVGAGESGAVKASFVTDGRYGPQTLRIHVRTDEGDGAGATLTLRGTVRAVLRPRPPRLLLGARAPGTAVDETIELDAIEPLEGLVAEPRGVDASIEGGVLRVRAVAPFAVGTRFGGVLLRFRHVASGRDLETWIPVVYTVPSPLVVKPAEVDLSGVRAELVVRPRWPGVASLRALRHDGMPLEVRRRDEGGAARFTLIRRGDAWEFPSSPRLLLDVDPPELGPVEVPLYLYGDE